MQDVPSTGTGFGNPTVVPTPAPGYSDRIPVEPIADEPYPSGVVYGDPTRPSAPATPGVTHGDQLAGDATRDMYPGPSGGGRG
jgi:hypothetical protein